jgi:argininosuccinate lyase
MPAMSSKVSGLLTEPILPELQETMYRPGIERDFPAVLPYMATINKAHIVMLHETGILSAGVARALLRATVDLERMGPSAFVLDPALEDPYFNYEAKVTELTGAEIGGQMHTARSRNDLKATQDRLRARDATLGVIARLIAVRRALVDRAARYADVVMPGYTHLQPAQPITYGYLLLGLATAFERDHERLSECYGRLNSNPLGAGALAGTSFPIDRARTAELLGFDRVDAHAQDSVASRDYLIELLSVCAQMAITWGRLAQDYYVMASYEFATIRFPDRVAGTSSMMPQKKNLTVLESLKARGATMLGAYVGAIAGVRGTNYTLTVDGSRDAFRWAWQAIDDTLSALAALRIVVEEAEPREERMLALVRANYSTATDLADALVRTRVLGFREAHHVVGAAVRLAMARNIPADAIDAALVAEAGREVLGRDLRLDAAAIAAAVDPVHAAEARAGTGGPAKSDMDRMRAHLTARIEADSAWHSAEERRLVAASAALDAAVHRLID